jgi:hypothetical protein
VTADDESMCAVTNPVTGPLISINWGKKSTKVVLNQSRKERWGWFVIHHSLRTFQPLFPREPVQSSILTTPRQNTYFPVRMSGSQLRSGTQSPGGCTHEMGRAICNLQSKEEQIYVCFTTLYLNPTPFPRTKQIKGVDNSLPAPVFGYQILDEDLRC